MPTIVPTRHRRRLVPPQQLDWNGRGICDVTNASVFDVSFDIGLQALPRTLIKRKIGLSEVEAYVYRLRRALALDNRVHFLVQGIDYVP